MFSSSTPSADQPDWHPVHRANALLQSALLGAPSAAPSEELKRIKLDAPWGGLIVEPAEITYPRSLTERLNAFARREESIAASRHEMRAVPELKPEGADICLHDLAGGVWNNPEENADAGALNAETQLDQAFRMVAPQAHVEALVHEFYRRQRRATLLVAGSLVAAVVLTFGGFLLIGSLVAHGTRTGDNWSTHSTSVAWKGPVGFAPARIQLAAVGANRAAKGEPLLIPAAAHVSGPSFGEMTPGTQVILASAGRPLALGPLLPSSHARYLFIRGLPAEAALSAGRRSSGGAWFVKDEEVQDLALSVGDAAKGDHPLDIYTLESGDAPQARRSLVLRVEAEQEQTNQPALTMDWASALLDLMPSASATVDPVVPADSTVLLKRAKSLLAEGDIAGARLILEHLAERGQGDAAYELARTYDKGVLTALGARGVSADQTIAHRWYEQASQQGNAKATERLKILASLSVSGPSD
jgi:hypothetical protein